MYKNSVQLKQYWNKRHNKSLSWKIYCLMEICLFYLQRWMFNAAINKSVWCRFMYKVDGKSTSSSAWNSITSPLKLWFSTVMCVK